MVNSRPMRQREQQIISVLLSRAHLQQVVDRRWRDWLVVELDDGGMGSLRFVRDDVVGALKIVAEVEFADTDGVLVSVALLADKRRQPAELDVFKVDFSPLIALPDFSASDNFQ